MQEVSVLEGSCHAPAEFLAKKFSSRIIVFISFFAALTWLSRIATKKPVFRLLQMMSLPLSEIMLLMKRC